MRADEIGGLPLEMSGGAKVNVAGVYIQTLSHSTYIVNDPPNP